jgi:hypothetical protein
MAFSISFAEQLDSGHCSAVSAYLGAAPPAQVGPGQDWSGGAYFEPNSGGEVTVPFHYYQHSVLISLQFDPSSSTCVASNAAGDRQDCLVPGSPSKCHCKLTSHFINATGA